MKVEQDYHFEPLSFLRFPEQAIEVNNMIREEAEYLEEFFNGIGARHKIESDQYGRPKNKFKSGLSTARSNVRTSKRSDMKALEIIYATDRLIGLATIHKNKAIMKGDHAKDPEVVGPAVAYWLREEFRNDEAFNQRVADSLIEMGKLATLKTRRAIMKKSGANRSDTKYSERKRLNDYLLSVNSRDGVHLGAETALSKLATFAVLLEPVEKNPDAALGRSELMRPLGEIASYHVAPGDLDGIVPETAEGPIKTWIFVAKEELDD